MKLLSIPFLLIATALLLIACPSSGPRALQQDTDPLKDSTSTAAAIDYNILRHADSALHVAREAQRLAEKTQAKEILLHWQDRELDILMRMRDTGLVRLASARIAEREGEAAAITMTQLVRWFKTNGNSRAADSLAKSALAVAHKPLLRAEALIAASLPTADLGRQQEALDMLEEALPLLDTTAHGKQYARLLASRGYTLFKTGAFDSAAAICDRALRRFESLGDTLSILSASSTRAAVATSQNDLATAVELQNRVIGLATELGFPNLVAANAFNKANGAKTLKRFTEALEGYELAQRTAEQCGMLDLAMIARGARAILWVDMDTATLLRTHTWQLYTDSALPVLDRAIADMKAIGNTYWEMNFSLSKAETHNWLGQRDSARVWYKEALGMAEAMSNPQGEAFALQGIGTGAYYDKDYRNAIRYWEKAIAINEAIGMPEQSALTWDRLHYAYKVTGQPLKALDALKRSKDIGFALYSDSVTQTVAQIEARFVYEKKLMADSIAHAAAIREKDLTSTKAQLGEAKANNRTLLIGSLALLLLGGGYAFYRDRQQRVRSEAALAIAQANELLTQEKLRTSEFQNKALRAQMEPHFIRNTIGLAIARLRKKSETSVDDASELLASFSEWIDRVLVTSQHTAHALADELSALGNYLDLQRLRMNNTFNYTVHVDAGIDAKHTQVPPMLLQPLLENAIEYGLEPQEGRGNLRLSAERMDGGLLLSVEDDGVGRNHPKPERPRTRSASVSTANIREQLAQLSERTGKPAGMRIIDLPKGTRVEVLLPI